MHMMKRKQTKRQSHNQWVVLLLIGLAFAVRLYRLGIPELWFDETASYFVAAKDYPDIIAYVRQSLGEHPPLY